MKIVIQGFMRGGTTATTGIVALLGVKTIFTTPIYVEDENLYNAVRKKDFDLVGRIIQSYGDNIAFKYGPPLLCLHYEHLKQVLPPHQTKVLTVFRNPLDVMDGIVKYKDYTVLNIVSSLDLPEYERTRQIFKNWMLPWMSSLLNFCATYQGPQLFISFDSLLRNPDPIIDKIASFCGVAPIDSKRRQVIKEYLAVKQYKDIRPFLERAQS